MDYIFKEWEEKLKAMADSVEKDLKEIRKCKADVQQMKLDVVAEVQKGRYVRDNEQLMKLLNDTLQSIDGVVSTETLISLDQSIKRDVPIHTED